MENLIIERLQLFGLTVNQAKTYLVIVQHKAVTVSKIASYTKFHRPDIYTMLPKLEKMGLITKTMGSPAVVEAIPIKKALQNLTLYEKKKAMDRIAKMEQDVDELANSINSLYKSESEPENQEIHFNLLTEDNEIVNMAETLSDQIKTECKAVLNIEVMGGRASQIYQAFHKAINNGAKVKVIVQAPELSEEVKAAVERIKLNSNNFSLKFLASKSFAPFQVVDDEVVWIGTSRKTEASKLPCILWSNSKNLCIVYSERFDQFWNSNDAILLYPKNGENGRSYLAAHMRPLRNR